MLRYPSVAVAVLVLIAVGTARPASGRQVPEVQQRLALIAKPAVVRVIEGFEQVFVTKNEPRDERKVSILSSGSGFFINADGYVVTNAHVVQDTHDYDQKGRAWVTQQLLFPALCRQLQRSDCGNVRGEYAPVTASFGQIHHVVIADGSAFPFEIKSFGGQSGEGSKDVAVVKVEVRNAPALKIADKGPELQEHVTVFGYPAAAESPLLAQQMSLEVTITDGRVSARKAMADAAPVLQISAAATHGNSGGPVLNDAGAVIGLLTFRGETVGGQEVSGFQFVVPSSTVMEFVRTSGAANTLGVVDTRYQEGLNFFWQHQYPEAIRSFEEVRRLFPQHSEIVGLIRRSQEELDRQAREPPPPPPSRLPWLIGAGAAVLVLAALGLFVRSRRRPVAASATPAQPAAARNPSQVRPSYAPLAADEEDRTVRSRETQTLGALACVSGPLSGQRFDVRPEGIYIGRDAALSQIVIDDPRVSKRHVWIGPRQGRMVAVDQASTNGTFLNDRGTEGIKEVFLKSGDTIIVSETEVGQFVYKR